MAARRTAVLRLSRRCFDTGRDHAPDASEQRTRACDCPRVRRATNLSAELLEKERAEIIDSAFATLTSFFLPSQESFSVFRTSYVVKHLHF